MFYISLYDNIPQQEESAKSLVAELFPLVPPKRRKEAIRYKSAVRQFMSLKSFCILQDLFGVKLPDWECDERGKPYYAEGVIASEMKYFSLSHCKNAIAVVVSDEPIGVDIESTDRQISDSLLTYTMSDDEVEYIKGSVNEKERFIALWTKKEAVLKLIGTGITGDMRGVLKESEHYSIETSFNREKNYICSVAVYAN